jgi:HAD superfamily hydrolase (TIGR01484 family)
LVTDLDGTLLDPSGGIHACDREAIGELRRRGVMVSIVTGRMYSGTREVARSLQLQGPVGCIDGSHIVDAQTDADLWRGPIGVGEAQLLGRLLDTDGLITVAFRCDQLLVDERATEHMPYLTKWSADVLKRESVLDELKLSEETAVFATVSLGSRLETERAAALIQLETRAALQTAVFHAKTDEFGELWGVLARGAGTSKATAAEWIARHHRVPLEQVVAVGDWLNDIPMLRGVGRSFAMAQAPQEVQKAATDVLDADTWSGGGIVEAARRSGWL